MPRTAPAPNALPIPGMCPGTWVMAGGGGAGGGSGGSGGGGAGKKGAGKGSGGKDAESDGKGGKSCGSGSSAGCSGCGSGVSAGDPVDLATGRVFSDPIVEVFIKGPIPLYFIRKYSSHSRGRDVGLGPGWAHTFAWEIVPRHRSVEVWDDSGTMLRFDMPDLGGSTRGPHGAELFRDVGGYRLFTDGLWHLFEDPSAAQGSQTQTAQSPPSQAPQGARPQPRLWLTAFEDNNQNRIRVVRDAQGRLAEIHDSVGRVLKVATTSTGRILSLKPPSPDGRSWVTRVTYRYDGQGRLAGASYPDGAQSEYGYHPNDLLAWREEPEAPRFHFLYDKEDRCKETWGTFRDPAQHGFATQLPATLADGVTPAKGVLHIKIQYYDEGYAEVADSVQVRRIQANDQARVDSSVSNGAVTVREYDAYGNLASHTDALGHQTRWVRAPNGAILVETDVLGNTTHYVRDTAGNVLEASDSLGLILRAEYDSNGNPTLVETGRGEIATIHYDSRGQPIEKTRPDGNRILLERDAHGNLARVQAADGGIWEWAHDYLGRRLEERRPDGSFVRYEWDARDRVVAILYPSGDVVRYRYDGAGNPVTISDSRRAWHLTFNGLGEARDVTHPDGTTTHYRYDREGRLVEVVNEKGEVLRRDLDPEGQPLKITSFDGTTTEYAFDLMGRLEEVKNPNGEVTRFERDPSGQVVLAEFDDGTEAKFEYNLRGELLWASNQAIRLEWTRGPGGLAEREDVHLGTDRYALVKTFNPMRELVRLESSVGFQMERSLDVPARRLRQQIDGVVIDSWFDGAGHELGRRLGTGVVLQNRWSGTSQLVERRLSTTRSSGLPEELAFFETGLLASKSFEYEPTGLLVERQDQGKPREAYRYDAMDQLLERQVNQRPVEDFRYDATGNVMFGTRSYRYGSGNRLEQSGSTQYSWDAAGRLVHKQETLDEGGVRHWRYHWNGAGFLERVTTPEGTEVSFAYDPFGRRVEKRVHRPGPTGLETAYCTRYVWHGRRVLHEITARDDSEQIRTYAYDAGGAPLAQRDRIRKDGEEEAGDWLFYLNDHLETPEALFTADGQIVSELQRSAWGQTTQLDPQAVSTPLRFEGQLEDPETGLHYNRYRYYDPSLGRYISEDPAGNLPDLNVFRYAINPIVGLDPLGLLHTVTNASFTPVGKPAVPLGDNGTIVSTFDEQTMRDVVDPNQTPNAAHYQNKLSQGKTPADGKSRACASAFAKEHFSDTEQKAMREVDRRFKPKDRRGGTLQMKGTLPPCSHCQKKMRAWSSKNAARVEYHHDGPNSPFVVDNRTPQIQAQEGGVT